MSEQYPECENCDFFIAKDDNQPRRCRKHPFVMPQIDWQLICSDWQHGGYGMEFENMEEASLYYYSYGAGLHTSRLASFAQLEHHLVSVRIRQDKSLGWVIVPGANHHYFPSADTFITIHIENRPSKFQVVNQSRTLAAEMIPAGDGKWEQHQHVQQSFMVYSLESPTLLFDWFNIHIDMEAYKSNSFAPSMFAFVEVIEQDKEYVLHPDLLTYDQYIRE